MTNAWETRRRRTRDLTLVGLVATSFGLGAYRVLGEASPFIALNLGVGGVALVGALGLWLRVPGAWDGFELAVRAVLGQQISVKGATTLSGRLVARFGERSSIAGGDADLHSLFPSAEALAAADLSEIGLPRARAAAISALAGAVADGELHLDAPRDLDAAIAQLTALPGIGEWTAHYVAMRALREPDAFPATDLGLRRALGGNGRPKSSAELRDIAEDWRPWRAYAAMLLWTCDPLDTGTGDVVHERP